MSQLRVAVLGCGGRGRGHMQILKAFEDVDLVAVCDVAEEKRNAVGDEFGVAQRYAEVEELLDGEQPDVAFVAPPAHLNAQVALPCLERGIDTLLEKPPGMRVSETVALRDAAERSGARAMVGWNRRFHPMIAQAREMVEARGAVTQLVGEFHNSITRDAAFGMFPESVLDNMLLESPIHSIDLMWAIAGAEIAEVHSVVRRAMSDYKDVHGALVLFENGCLLHLIHNYTTDARLERYEIHGQNISAYLEGVSRGVVLCDGQTHELGASSVRASSGTVEQNRYFLDCVQEDRPVSLPAANLDEAVKTMELAEAILAGLRSQV